MSGRVVHLVRKLCDIGEKNLIRELLSRYAMTARVEHLDDCVVLDCAEILGSPGAPYLVYSIDHPSRIDRPLPTGMEWRFFGRWIAACTCNDVLAMGARPAGLSLDLAAPQDIDVHTIESIYNGLNDVLAEYGARLEGGNLDINSNLEVVGMAWGTVPRNGIIRRGGARVGDYIAVTTELGIGWASYELRRRNLFDLLPESIQAELAGYNLMPLAPHKAIVDSAHLLPRALTSGMDLTDGMMEFLYTITESSGLGARVEERFFGGSPTLHVCAELLKVPTAAMAFEFGYDTPRAHGFTVDPARWDQVQSIFTRWGAKLHRIGDVVAEPVISWQPVTGRAESLPRMWDDQYRRNDCIRRWYELAEWLRPSTAAQSQPARHPIHAPSVPRASVSPAAAELKAPNCMTRGAADVLDEYSVITAAMRRLELIERAPFAGCDVLAVQHVHSSLIPLVEALCQAGVERSDVTVVAKSYSARPLAVAELRERRVRVIDPERMRDPGQSYEIELAERVAAVLDELAADDTTRPLLVLDEGAVAMKLLVHRPELATRAKVVEQTTRGARWAETASLLFPVVDVARSATKAEIEAPMVARSMVTGLLLALSEIPLTRPERMGLIGYGRMGAKLSSLLSDHFDVAVHDLDEWHAELARANRLRVRTFDELLAESELIMGCTGSVVLTEQDLASVSRPLVLANGASSDIEFALWHKRCPAAIIPGAIPGDAYQPWRNHYLIDATRRHAMLAGGFPVNFYPPGEPIPATKFQLTRSLMLAGAAQVVGASRAGLMPLDTEIQRTISAAFESATWQAEVSAS